ncbi:MAG: sensor histidine kinase [Lacipirellulaceae bacterium]
MIRPAAQLGLPRRVVGLFLLFSLAAVASLSAGSFFAARSLLATHATEGSLANVGRLAAAVRMDSLRNDGKHIQQLLDQSKAEGRLAFAAVVGPDGRFLAHTDRSLISAVALEMTGDQLRWGEVDGVRYADSVGNAVNEYHAPMQAGGKPLGTLRLALVEPGLAGTLLEFAHYAPLAILTPTLMILAGGWMLARMTQPVASLEASLARVARTPYGEAPDFERVAPTGIAAVGWNQAVAYVETLRAALADGERRGGEQVEVTPRGSGKVDAALASLAEGIVVTDAEGRIDFANRAVAALLGDADSLANDPFVETLARLTPATAGKFDAGPQARVVTEATLAVGAESRTLRVERLPLRGEPGHVWAVRDVTQQKLAEKSRDQFIDTATHELRTPLANIKAYAETLSTCDIGDVEQQKEFCNTINAEATRLARFVDDLLSISSLEVGSLGVTRQNTDVRRLVEEAAEKVRPLARAKSLKFETSLAEKLGEASLDKDKVSSLLVNLLGNAAKYTPVGGTIALAAARKGETLEFEVRDTGVGIAADECERVFEKFFRSANPAVQDEVGTGLGLPLAREIARLHRGDVTLTSSLGEGSTFTVTLPVA